MMFRLFLLIFAVALSFIPPFVKAGPFDGFHAGSYSVISSGTVERQDFIGEVDGVALNGVEDTQALERGLTAGLSLGYGRVFQNKWFVSGEGFFNIGGAGELTTAERAYHDYSIDLTGDDDDAAVLVEEGRTRSLRTRDKHSFGFLARGGYRVAPGSIFYGLIGYSVSSVESRLTPYAGGAQSAVFVKSSDNQGFLLGAGSEINLTENLSARMDFVHDQREAVDITVGNYPEFSEQEISGQALKVGLTWRFGQHTFRGSTEDTDAEVTLSPGRLLGYRGLGLYAGMQGAYGYVPYNERSVIGNDTHRSDTGGFNGTGVGFFFGVGTDMAPILGRKYRDWYIGVEGGGTYDFFLENDEREIDGIGGNCGEGADNQIQTGVDLSCFDRVTVDTNIEYSVSATTRLGYMPNEHSMIYLRFGYGWAYYEVERGQD